MGESVLCFVMVETREAVEKIDKIAGTPGLDGIYVGPSKRRRKVIRDGQRQ